MFDPPGEYDPKEAMQRRYDALKEACMIYADFMRPERFVTEIVPDREGGSRAGVDVFNTQFERFR